MALGHQNGLRLLIRPIATILLSVITEAIDINSDPGYCRAKTYTWPSAAAQAWTAPWSQVVIWVTRISKVPEAARHSDTNKATGCGSDHGLLCDLW